MNSPTHAGHWYWKGANNRFPMIVTVTETPTSGRRCDQLKMGGSLQCGYADWSGTWEPVEKEMLEAS